MHKIMNGIKKFIFYNKRGFAYGFILVLMISDFFAVRQLFYGVGTSEQIICSFILATALEGFPTLLGRSYSKYKSETQHNANEKKRMNVGIVLGLVGFFLTAFTMIALRVLKLSSEWRGLVISMKVSSLMLTIHPIITSVLAFATSWEFLGADDASDTKIVCEDLLKTLNEKTLAFQECYQELESKRDALWTSFSHGGDDRPKTASVFRSESYKRIRAKLIANCTESFPDQIERYNLSVESALKNFLVRMSSQSTIPEQILSIDVNSILKEYDEKVNDEKQRWASDVLSDEGRKELQDRLEMLISNRIIHIQRTTNTK